MKAVYYYRGHTGSAGFLLLEDMALLKRLFAHGSLPPKAQLRGKRCWLYLRVDTGNPMADEIGISGQDTYLRQFAEENGMQIAGVYKDYMSGRDLRRPAFSSWSSRLRKRKWIISFPVNGIGSTGAMTCGASCGMRTECIPSAWTSCIPSNRTDQTGIHPISLRGALLRCAPVFTFGGECR